MYRRAFSESFDHFRATLECCRMYKFLKLLILHKIYLVLEFSFHRIYSTPTKYNYSPINRMNKKQEIIEFLILWNRHVSTCFVLYPKTDSPDFLTFFTIFIHGLRRYLWNRRHRCFIDGAKCTTSFTRSFLLISTHILFSLIFVPSSNTLQQVQQ